MYGFSKSLPSRALPDYRRCASLCSPRLSLQLSFPRNPAVRANLRPYQTEGVSWLVSLSERKLNGILADEMGLGKTLQTIALLAWHASAKGEWGPHLVVVPTSVMLNWEMEFKRWAPGFKASAILHAPGEASYEELTDRMTGTVHETSVHCVARGVLLVVHALRARGSCLAHMPSGPCPIRLIHLPHAPRLRS